MSVSSAIYRTAVAEDLPETMSIKLGDVELQYRKVRWPDGEVESGLRYGENPHQPAAFYAPAGAAGPLAGLRWRKLGKGGPSWTNLADLEHATRVLKVLERPAVLVMKHLNPAGVAVQQADESLAELVRGARACDERAAFGGVVVFNRTVDGAAAAAALEGFVEVVAAPEFTPAALEVFAAKKDLRVAELPSFASLPKFVGDAVGFEIKVLGDGSMLVQRPYLSRIRSTADLDTTPSSAGVAIAHQPTPAELNDMVFAWHVAAAVRSNAVVLVKDGRTLAVGTGEQERVGAVEQAITKALQKGHNLQGAIVASDAFFPFRDAIDALAAAGVRGVVQPGGSVRDAEVIAACNEHGMTMAFTGERCFSH